MKMRKKFSCVLILFLICTAFLSTSISAKETVSDDTSSYGEELVVPDEDISTSEMKGSITIKLTDTKSGHSKEDVEFGLAKVADIEKGSYVTCNGYDVDFNEIETANELELASRKLQILAHPDKTVITNEEGIAEAKNLSVGVYLVYVLEVNKYENITPFLIAIPTFDKIDKEMIYDVSVLPKHSPLPDIQVNKVDSVTKKNITNKDFEFTMYEDEDCTKELKTVKGDKKKGVAVFEEVTFGTFYVKETKAPKGYKLSDEVVKVVIDDSFASSEKQTETIIYQNTPLPAGGGVNTGDTTNYLLFVLLGLGSFSFLAVCVIKHKQSKAQSR